MIERLSYDPSSLVDERGDVVPAADHLDIDGDIVEPPPYDDNEVLVHIEPVKPRYDEFQKAEEEYDKRLEALADRYSGDYELARMELARHNYLPPERSMYGLPPEVEEDLEIARAVPAAILEDSLRRRINDIFKKQSPDPNSQHQKNVEAMRLQAVFYNRNRTRLDD